MANDVVIYQEMIDEIKEIMRSARNNVARQVNNEILTAYWNIGRVIVEHEQDSNDRAGYGKETMRKLSKQLTKELGKGFSLSNVYNMRQFYLDYPKFQSLTGKLTWTHYCELMSISDKDRRSFYEKECARSGWSVRELKRQVSTSLYERLLLTDGNMNKEKVYELATLGQELATPEDIVKDAYVFELLGIPENKSVHESELDKALVRQIEDFMLELGRGFMFVGTQQRVTLNNTHYYVDRADEFLPELLSGRNEYGGRHRTNRNCPWCLPGQAGYALCVAEYYESGVCDPLPTISSEQGTAGSRISPVYGWGD
jgi:predicted nuclease of restriction endonuclease-like (RecB) superfamily